MSSSSSSSPTQQPPWNRNGAAAAAEPVPSGLNKIHHQHHPTTTKKSASLHIRTDLLAPSSSHNALPSSRSSIQPVRWNWFTIMALSHASIISLAFWFGSEYGSRLALEGTMDGTFGGGWGSLAALGGGGGGRSDLSALPYCDEDEITTTTTSSSERANAGNEALDGAASRPSTESSESPNEVVRPWKFPPQIKDFVAGAARVNRHDFLTTFDDGLPGLDAGATPGNHDVLMLYDSPGALPDNFKDNLQHYSSATEATSNCRYLRVLTLDVETDEPVCLAIQGNNAEPHYFVHKWLQQPDGTFRAASRYEEPLPPPPSSSSSVHKSSKQQKKRSPLADPPKPVLVTAANKILQQYLSHYTNYTLQLKALVEPIAEDNTLVVMVCNRAHIDLLLNYACAARHRNVLPSNVVVLSMDEDTHRAATKIAGLTSFYQPRLFAFARAFQDGTEYGSLEYAHLMVAKLLAAHLISDAGYHMVFHDVDVVPYQDYYVHLLKSVVPRYPDFELFLQYDFTTDPLYAPWGANSGFWFARNTDKTRYFFSLLLRRVALVLKARSHQAAMSVVLSEVTNHYGLRAKVMDRHGHEFPGT